ncbi:hypothetical protein PV327_004398 [Microctonus hyperodae]|uniref:Uncharacterized protein n=1 Tax=Microctonus hyperodae TaxID=165561 RepID=A0AA39KML8_MICHY|nr:hypothetical protein PV327_004398 [Microctonus hyperodae]
MYRERVTSKEYIEWLLFNSTLKFSDLIHFPQLKARRILNDSACSKTFASSTDLHQPMKKNNFCLSDDDVGTIDFLDGDDDVVMIVVLVVVIVDCTGDGASSPRTSISSESESIAASLLARDSRPPLNEKSTGLSTIEQIKQTNNLN